MFKKIIIFPVFSILFSASVFANQPNQNAVLISSSIRTHFTHGEKTKPPFTVKRVIISGPYAIASWLWGEAGGQAVLKQSKGKWIVLSAGGGQIGEVDLIEKGVPASYAKTLIAKDRSSSR